MKQQFQGGYHRGKPSPDFRQEITWKALASLRAGLSTRTVDIHHYVTEENTND